MEQVYGLLFTLFFDLVLLVALRHYHRRLGYRFLKFGAMALVLEMLSQTLFYTAMFFPGASLPIVLGGICKMIFTALLLACVADIVGRPAPLRGMLFALNAYLLIVIGVLVDGGSGRLPWMVAQLPAIALLVGALVMVVRQGSRDSIAMSSLGGLLAVHLGLKLILPIVAPGPIFDLVFFFNAIVVMLIAVALLMTTSERMIRDLGRKDERIEEYKQQTDRLEWQFSQAQKLESLGMLAGGIAHDFNNMLTSILGYASLAMRKLPVDSEVRKDIYMIMSGARQAVDLTSQMLVYAGKGAIEFEAVDISKVVDNMSSLMHSIVPRKIQLVQKLSRDLPALKGDKVQLGQVVMNLVANSVDAVEGDSGCIEISTGLAKVDERLLRASFFGGELEPGAYLYLRVEDDGIGMDDEQLARIFDPFYSEKQSSKGLGLSSLSGIVRQHGGFIYVESVRGKGTKFAIYFPVVAYGETPDQRIATPDIEKRRKGNILLAEDDPRIRSLITSVLERENYTVSATEDGKEALECYEAAPHEFDLLVLDCTMPKLSGTDVYRRVRIRGADVPVILISGYHQEQVINNISNDDNAWFVKKPFNLDAFMEEVARALHARYGDPV